MQCVRRANTSTAVATTSAKLVPTTVWRLILDRRNADAIKTITEHLKIRNPCRALVSRLVISSSLAIFLFCFNLFCFLFFDNFFLIGNCRQLEIQSNFRVIYFYLIHRITFQTAKFDRQFRWSIDRRLVVESAAQLGRPHRHGLPRRLRCLQCRRHLQSTTGNRTQSSFFYKYMFAFQSASFQFIPIKNNFLVTTSTLNFVLFFFI